MKINFPKLAGVFKAYPPQKSQSNNNSVAESPLEKSPKDDSFELSIFIFIGECWLNEKFSQRHVSLTKSGVIPRLYTLPMILCEVLGKNIQRDGRIDSASAGSIGSISGIGSTPEETKQAVISYDRHSLPHRNQNVNKIVTN